MTLPTPRSTAPCCSPAASALSIAPMMPSMRLRSSPTARAVDFFRIVRPSSNSLVSCAPAGELRAGHVLLADLIYPGKVAFGVGLDGVLPAADRGDGEFAVPAIVVARLQRALQPGRRSRRAHLETCGELVVTFLVDIGGDGNFLADDALDGETAAICGSTASMITRG